MKAPVGLAVKVIGGAAFGMGLLIALPSQVLFSVSKPLVVLFVYGGTMLAWGAAGLGVLVAFLQRDWPPALWGAAACLVLFIWRGNAFAYSQRSDFQAWLLKRGGA